MVVKGQAITLTCSVDEPGRPEANEFIWKRGGQLVHDVNTFNWTIDPVTLETEANISCVAKNDVGLGSPDFINIQVIGKLQPLKSNHYTFYYSDFEMSPWKWRILDLQSKFSVQKIPKWTPFKNDFLS